MEYNSLREKLLIPEYGRHIQKMINKLNEIEDDEKRQVYANRIIELMNIINPQNRNPNADERLWKHFFRIGKFEVDVMPPDGNRPTAESIKKDPVKPKYNQTKISYRHYGNYIQKMIDKAAVEPDEEKQKEFLILIGSYMKLAYKTWNPEHYVSDENILADLKNLCKGKIKVSEPIPLDALDSSKAVRKEKTALQIGKKSGRGGRGRKKRRR